MRSLFKLSQFKSSQPISPLSLSWIHRITQFNLPIALLTLSLLSMSGAIMSGATAKPTAAICSETLGNSIQDNRSLETLEKCYQELPDRSPERAEIQRQLALIYYDRIGSLSSDRLSGNSRSEKLKTLETQLENSRAIAIETGELELGDRIQYTLGQIRANELDRLSQTLIKPEKASELQFQIANLDTQLNSAITPFRQSRQLESKLYQARLLAVTLPQFYRVLSRKSCSYQPTIAPECLSEEVSGQSPTLEQRQDFDRLLRQTQAYQIELLQLLPALQQQLIPPSSTPNNNQLTNSDAIDRILYHAVTIARLRSLQQSITRFQTIHQRYQNSLPAIDPMSSPLWSQLPAQSFKTQAEGADRNAADLLIRTIQTTQPLMTSGNGSGNNLSPAELQQLKRQHIQAKLALIDLYPDRDQAEIAKTLITRDLLLSADSLNSPEISAQLYGRYAKAQLDSLQCKIITESNRADCQSALQASENAIRRIETVRGDLLSLAPDVQYSYRESIATLYRDNLELQFAQSNPDLEKILTRLESLKLAEIHNYFREPCIEAKVQLNQFINQTLPNTHLIYTIVFDDRLEVITKLSDRNTLTRYQTPIRRTELEATARQFRDRIIAEDPYSQAGQQLYRWIFQAKDAAGKTFEDQLSANSTLVMVADSELQNIPFAALSRPTANGNEHLIDRFSIVMSPGLTLFEPKPLRSPQLLFAAQSDFPNFTNVNPLPGTQTELNDLKAAKLLPSQAPAEQVLFTAPNSTYQAFNRTNFETAITEQSFNVVHLATHGKFSSDQEQTGLIMGNEFVNTAALSTILQKRDRKRSESLELLILSACETAEGDDRAPIGLAGLALRSGARSTVAGLWSLSDSDKVTPAFLRTFYEEVFTRKRNKAEALRQAQLSLRKDRISIGYWSAFVLVGNWL